MYVIQSFFVLLSFVARSVRTRAAGLAELRARSYPLGVTVAYTDPFPQPQLFRG